MAKDNVSLKKLLLGVGLFSVGLGLWQAIAPASVAKTAGLERRRKLLRLCGAREMAAGAGILTRGSNGPWLKSRIAGDVMDLAILGVGFASPRTNKKRLAFATAAVAGVTALDLYCAKPAKTGILKAALS